MVALVFLGFQPHFLFSFRKRSFVEITKCKVQLDLRSTAFVLIYFNTRFVVRWSLIAAVAGDLKWWKGGWWLSNLLECAAIPMTKNDLTDLNSWRCNVSFYYQRSFGHLRCKIFINEESVATMENYFFLKISIGLRRSWFIGKNVKQRLSNINFTAHLFYLRKEKLHSIKNYKCRESEMSVGYRTVRKEVSYARESKRALPDMFITMTSPSTFFER